MKKSTKNILKTVKEIVKKVEENIRKYRHIALHRNVWLETKLLQYENVPQILPPSFMDLSHDFLLYLNTKPWRKQITEVHKILGKSFSFTKSLAGCC